MGDVAGHTAIRSSILYNNTAKNFDSYGTTPLTLYVSDSDIEGYPVAAEPQFHNIDADPKFVDSANGDYHLQDASPCIDKGIDPPMIVGPSFYDPYDASLYPAPVQDATPASPPAKGTIRNDMGAYGGPGAANGIGPETKADTDPNDYLREDKIGTY
jgi:hypothetical protein